MLVILTTIVYRYFSQCKIIIVINLLLIICITYFIKQEIDVDKK